MWKDSGGTPFGQGRIPPPERHADNQVPVWRTQDLQVALLPKTSTPDNDGMLIIFGGLPGVGKTALARELARLIGALHLRVDSIEQAIRASGVVDQPLNDAGYRVAYAVAEDNLRIGRTVIADSVNPIQWTRDAWVEVANRVKVKRIEIEATCSDSNEHQRRVEVRTTDIPGLRLPTWDEIVSREYHTWHREHLVIDTADRTVQQNVKLLREMLPQ